ncbi:MAG: sulfur relay protein DsrC [Proteobacteria bacterium]|nr:sulfur relay protein DsrC [Pseudomonadota bacterium]
MLWLSEILLENHDLNTFAELTDKVREKAASGEMFFRMDVKPTYPDTPDNWEDRLEAVFTSVLDQHR